MQIFIRRIFYANNRIKLKRIIFRWKLKILSQKRYIKESSVRKHFKKVVFFKVKVLQTLSFFFNIMGKVVNIIFPVYYFLNAIESKFSEMTESITEELQFAFRAYRLLKCWLVRSCIFQSIPFLLQTVMLIFTLFI